jgi:hypothetical protein
MVRIVGSKPLQTDFTFWFNPKPGLPPLAVDFRFCARGEMSLSELPAGLLESLDQLGFPFLLPLLFFGVNAFPHADDLLGLN